MPIVPVCLRLALLACVLATAVAQAAAPALAPLAHSALLAVDAAAGAGGVTLRVRRASGEAPLVVSDLAVTIDDRSEPAAARPDGSWFLPRPSGAQDAGKTIAVTVGHDGIHEVLTGRLLPASAGGSGAGGAGAGAVMSSSRKQLFWWILTIAIVAIAAIAISRRTS